MLLAIRLLSFLALTEKHFSTALKLKAH